MNYLGLRLTTTLNYTAQVKRATHTAIGNLVQLFPLLAKDSTHSATTKLHIYKTSIRSALTYAAPVWCSISDSTYQQMQAVQNKCLRVISNSPRRTPISRLHSSLGIDYIQSFLRQPASRFYFQCQTHHNPLIGSIGQYTLHDLNTMYKRYKHKRPKHILL